MRTCLALTLLLLFPGLSGARITTAWTYEAMYEKADLVVIAKPVSVSQSDEVESLPNFNPKTKFHVLQTTFVVSVALKGPKPDKLVLRHFKLMDPFQFAVAGPSFIEFDTTQRLSYLMFLSSAPDSSYSPVTGQADAAVAIIRLEGSVR